jgi:hypothetical protein
VFIYFDPDPSEPLGVRGVGSSNLPVPTNVSPLFLCFFNSVLGFAATSHFASCDVIWDASERFHRLPL